jgi:hypothetical protein
MSIVQDDAVVELPDSVNAVFHYRAGNPQARLDAVLPDSVHAIEKARGHGRLEYANNVPIILPTITAWDTNFAVMSTAPDGTPDLKTVFDFDGVEPWYIMQEQTIVRHTTYRVSEYNGRWFAFNEMYADLTSATSGETLPCHVAVIFPTWSDGIIGEIAFGEPAWGNRALDGREMRALSRQLDAYNEAWRHGDLDARLGTVQDNTCSVIRIVEADGDRRHRAVARTKAELREAWAAPAEGRVLDLDVRQQFATSWYVFEACSALIELADRTVERETARLLPLGPDRKFIGELTYCMETTV